ncbi:JAB domain-containing protein [Candidatus Saccharibacteria bacterium]|nr:JAB domain-containing protein [Candidatus Saccharibacteria bacterium]
MLVDTTKKAESYLRRVMQFDQEEFWVLAFTSNQILIQSKMIFLGTVDSCVVHPREVFRFAMSVGASKILIAHGHPSGDPTPSLEDLKVTRRLVQSSQIVGIPIVDHLILTRKSVSSFEALKLFRNAVDGI